MNKNVQFFKFNFDFSIIFVFLIKKIERDKV